MWYRCTLNYSVFYLEGFHNHYFTFSLVMHRPGKYNCIHACTILKVLVIFFRSSLGFQGKGASLELLCILVTEMFLMLKMDS